MIEIVSGAKKIPLDFSPLSGADILQKTGNKNPNIVGLTLNGNLYDLFMPLPSSGDLEWVVLDSPKGEEIVRHSCAHVMAQAVKALYKNVQVTIGPVIENGFYYDFSRPEGPFKEEDLPVIEAKMAEIIASKIPLKREEWAVTKALDFFKAQGELYKCEIISDIAQKTGAKEVSVYWQGDFVDLCRGPHVPTTGHIPAVKLTHVAGAYWRGSEDNEMLTRIYGVAFASQKALKQHLFQLEEAKKRDHRRVGMDMNLFSFHTAAPASPFFHPNGAAIYIAMQTYLRELNLAYGFQDVISPLVMSQDMWKTSGHYDNYRENMYFTKVDERDFAIKPMNCPGHCLIYSNTRHSYRELPLRFAEFGRVHRHERSGVTAGLFRVRSFVQDDAHIFCTEEQVEDEVSRVLKMINTLYKTLDFTYRVELSTRPEKRVGEDSLWDKAEGALKQSLEKAGLDYQLNPGDGAFYGPKIDFHLKDSIGRSHQCGTIQLDFSMPRRFDLQYLGADNHSHYPVMIHRAIAGSLERFIGILIEHYAGDFPTWLAPVQVVLVTVTEEAKDYAWKIYNELKDKRIRVFIDDSEDKLGAKIKKYRGLKSPFMLILGKNEAENSQVSIRLRNGDQENSVDYQTFLARLEAESRLPSVS